MITIINIITIIIITAQLSSQLTSSSSSSSFTATTNGFCTLPIYIRTAHVFFSLLATTGAASVPQMRLFSFAFYSKSQKHVFHTRGQNNFIGKTHGFCTLPIYIRTPHVFFHYWRRRDPPVSLRCGENSSGFTTKVKF